MKCGLRPPKWLFGEQHPHFAESPVSPDSRYVGLSQWVDDPVGPGRTQVLHILNRESHAVKTLELPGKDLSLVGWNETESGLRAVVVTNR
jgi:hypothetical protein